MPNNATKKPAPNLAATQALLKQVITHPGGIADAMRTYGIRELPITAGPHLNAVARAEIYNQMYYLRLLEALRNDFACIEYYVGTTAFEQLAADYLSAHPPTHYSLRYLGQHLADYLPAYAPLQHYAFLLELAQFEWAIISAFDAPEHNKLCMEDLQNIAPEHWAELTFTLCPSLSIVECQWPIDTLREQWKASHEHNDGSTEFIASNASATSGKPLLAPQDPAIVATETCALLTWRPALDVLYRRLEPHEASLLKALAAGETFGTICELADTPEQAAGLLQRGMSEGIIINHL